MKFAYLIMAHHRFDVLKEILHDLDDERNSIYLHIDKKTIIKNIDELTSQIKKAKIVIVPRIKVYWGHFSQVECVVELLKRALESGYHDYYHLLVGVEFPLKSQDYIHSFFEKNKGKEFIGYDLSDSKDYLDRIKYYHFETKYARSEKRFSKHKKLVGQKLLDIQRRLRVNRLKMSEERYKKGYANWSITHDLARYLVEQYPKISKQYKHTFCGDEIIFHTLVYNSNYYQNVYDLKNEYRSAMRLTTWDNWKNQLTKKDLKSILESDKLFGRKFDTDDAVELIQYIKLNRQ